MACLLIAEGDSDGRAFALDEHRLVSLGRDDDCTVQILDPQVSRRHLQIRFEPDDDAHYAADFRSANGVFVNGERVADDVRLSDGDKITIGNTDIWYRVEDSIDPDIELNELRKRGEWNRSTLKH